MGMAMIVPHIGDHVYNAARSERGQMPHGYVVRLSKQKWGEREDRECVVKYFKPLRIFSQADPEFGMPGGDFDSISFDEFELYKISSELPEGTFKDYRTETEHGRRVADKYDLCRGISLPDNGPGNAIQVSCGSVVRSRKEISRITACLLPPSLKSTN
jgi:hypothetical protein